MIHREDLQVNHQLKKSLMLLKFTHSVNLLSKSLWNKESQRWGGGGKYYLIFYLLA